MALTQGRDSAEAELAARIENVMAFEKWKAGAKDNPMLRPLARPLGWIMGQIRAPSTPDLPGGWKEK